MLARLLALVDNVDKWCIVAFVMNIVNNGVSSVARYEVQLTSSSLRSADYDEDSEMLNLHFVNGRSYTFFKVPLNIYEGLRDARSPGQYFNQEIKGRYG